MYMIGAADLLSQIRLAEVRLFLRKNIVLLLLQKNAQEVQVIACGTLVRENVCPYPATIGPAGVVRLDVFQEIVLFILKQPAGIRTPMKTARG